MGAEGIGKAGSRGRGRREAEPSQRAMMRLPSVITPHTFNPPNTLVSTSHPSLHTPHGGRGLAREVVRCTLCGPHTRSEARGFCQRKRLPPPLLPPHACTHYTRIVPHMRAHACTEWLREATRARRGTSAKHARAHTTVRSHAPIHFCRARFLHTHHATTQSHTTCTHSCVHTLTHTHTHTHTGLRQSVVESRHELLPPRKVGSFSPARRRINTA